MYDAVGAGSRAFGNDGRTENGGWDASVTGARGQNGVKGVGDVGAMLGLRPVKNASAKRSRDGTVQGAQEHETARKIQEVPLSQRRKLITDEPEVAEEAICALATHAVPAHPSTSNPPSQPAKRPIFASLTVYINGSTAPLVSDHHLKYLLVEHGATVAIGLGRRSVTHVVLGQGNLGPGKGGAGGGLAAGKIEKEIRRVGGGGHGGVRFVGVEW